MREPSWPVDVVVAGILAATVLSVPSVVSAAHGLSPGRARDTSGTALTAAPAGAAAAGAERTGPGAAHPPAGPGHRVDGGAAAGGSGLTGAATRAGGRTGRTGTARVVDPGTPRPRGRAPWSPPPTTERPPWAPPTPAGCTPGPRCRS